MNRKEIEKEFEVVDDLENEDEMADENELVGLEQ